MPSVKIIVAGGREFSDWNLLFKTIKEALQELFDNGYKKEHDWNCRKMRIKNSFKILRNGGYDEWIKQ